MEREILYVSHLQHGETLNITISHNHAVGSEWTSNAKAYLTWNNSLNIVIRGKSKCHVTFSLASGFQDSNACPPLWFRLK